MGGSVGVESQLDQGSRFYFTAKLQKSGKNNDKPVVDDSDNKLDLQALKKVKLDGFILLVEDNKTNQEVVCDLLSILDVEIKVANNGLEALEVVRISPPLLILMDMQMPKMDGIQATIEIRKITQLSNIPIIAMTANAFKEDKEQCLQVGMNDHLAKPVEPNKLYDMLAEYLYIDKAALSGSNTNLSITEESSQCPSSIIQISMLDIDDAMVYFNGNCSRYLKELQRFVKDRVQDVQAVKSILDSSIEKDEAKIIIHTLKGVSATLGMNTIKELCQEIETNLNNNGDVTHLIDALDKEHVAILKELKTHLPDTYEVEQTEQGIDIDQIVARLISMLENDDYQCHDYILENESVLEKHLSNFHEIKTLAINYDTEEALALLQNA